MGEVGSSSITFYVYVDWTLETEPRAFYVGKGNQARLSRLKRNKHHTNVAQKYGIRREIVMATSDESATLVEEKRLIAHYHTFRYDPLNSGIGCNYTLGGEGSSGHHKSSETLAKWREKIVGQKRTPEQRANISASLKGKPLGEAHRRALMKSVARCDDQGNVLETYPSVQEAAIAVQGYASNIVHAARGLLSRHRGFRWKYMTG